MSDSPWLWVAIFAAIGLAGLFAMGGKYGRRQSQLEMQFQARQRIERNQAEELGARSPDEPLEYSQPESTMIMLWPLRVLVLVVLVAAIWMHLRWLRSHETSSSSKIETHHQIHPGAKP